MLHIGSVAQVCDARNDATRFTVWLINKYLLNYCSKWDSMIPVATAAFNDSAWPLPGMVMACLINGRILLRIPFDSLPMTSMPSFIFVVV